ncbi:MAG: TRAP transporter substrate-binding protein [Desulfobacterales bacterium]|nr:TRAP transporter substrate-binding protein [Desulfobacterales bacterium]
MTAKKVLGIVLGLLLIVGMAGSAQAEKPIELAFALHTAPGGPDHMAVDVFKGLVESRSNGRLKVNLFPGAQLGGERDNLEQLKQGEVALTQSGDLCVSLYAPEYGAAIIPFVFPSVESVFKAWDGMIGKEIKKAFMEKGKIHLVGIQRRGSRMLTAKKEIRTPDDLNGLKIRVPEIPTWVEVWKEMGALPTVVAWPEVFGALQTGVVEAQENPLYLIYTTKLYEVQNYVMLTAHVQAAFHWLMSDKVLSSLPKDLQEIVLQSAAQASEYGDMLTAKQENDYKQKLQDVGMKVIAVDVKPFMQKAQPAIERIRQKWAPGVYEEVQKIINP